VIGDAHGHRRPRLVERFALLRFVAPLVVRLAEAFAAPLAFVLPRAVFAAFAFFGAARFAVAFLADDFFTVRFRRFGCIAIGGISKGSDTSPAAANGM
jgi:hypothetical protein